MPGGSDRRSLAALLALGAIWGATFPVAEVGVRGGANPFLLVALVLGLAALVTLPYAAARRAPRPGAFELLRSAGLGALLIAGINLPLYWGLRTAAGGTASIVYATSPLLSILALRALRSPVEIGRRQAAALGAGLSGVVLLGWATVGASLLAGVAALAAFVIGASCQGTGAVLVGRARPHGEGPWGLGAQFVGGATAAFVALPWLGGRIAFPLTAPVIGSFLYVGLVSMVVGYSLFFLLIDRVGAVRANQVTFLNPIVAVAIGTALFAEPFRPLELAALALILAALYLLQPRAGRSEVSVEAMPSPIEPRRRATPSGRA